MSLTPFQMAVRLAGKPREGEDLGAYLRRVNEQLAEDDQDWREAEVVAIFGLREVDEERVRAARAPAGERDEED